MTTLSIPGTSPSRPGASGASANDLSSRHQSATLNMATGQIVVENKGVQKASSAAQGTGSSVFSRVQSRSGTIEDAGLDSIVSGPSIPGDGVRLRDALAAGFVHKNEDGTYSAGPGHFGEKADKDKKADDAKADKDKGDTGDGEHMGDETEKTIDALIEGSTPDEQLAAVAQVAERGEVSADLIASVAQSAGVSTEAMGEQVGNVIAAFETQARDAIEAASGVDSETVVAWLRENKMEELKAAEFAHATRRSTEGYVTLAKTFVLTMDEHNPEAILGATFPDGQSAHRDGTGQIIITVDGQEYPWASAVRAGFVSIKAG